jgi:chromosome segregation ATPase
MSKQQPKPLKGAVSTSEDQLQVLESEKRSHEEVRAKMERELKSQKSEQQILKKQIEIATSEISQTEAQMAANEQLIARAPSLTEALRKKRKVDVAVEELKKESEFIERQGQELENKWNIMQSDQAMKEDEIRNKKMILERMNPDDNRGAFQAAQSEIRMLESNLTRSQPLFRKAEEDAKRFQARIYDLQMQMKQLRANQRQAEQDETSSRRLEVFVSENARLKFNAEKKRSEMNKNAEDLKKIERSVKKLEERLKREDMDLSTIEAEINQIKHKK